MALGLPVIAADWGGPADYLDERCGILVSPTPRDTFAARLADAMCRLAQSPQLRKRLGAAGASKVAEQYNWGDKVDRMVALYEEVAARTRSDRA
jgi:glycosyltransferase involved in cell wall biosynthesis